MKAEERDPLGASALAVRTAPLDAWRSPERERCPTRQVSPPDAVNGRSLPSGTQEWEAAARAAGAKAISPGTMVRPPALDRARLSHAATGPRRKLAERSRPRSLARAKPKSIGIAEPGSFRSTRRLR